MNYLEFNFIYLYFYLDLWN